MGWRALAPCVTCPHPETGRLEAKQLRMCLLSKRDVILSQKSKDTGFIRTYVCSTSRPIGRRLQIFTPRCPPRPRERCHEQLHHMCVHGRAAVAIYSRKSRSGDARLEVHSAISTLLLHPSGANNYAVGDTGPVRTQGDSWALTVGVVRAHRQCGEAQRVSRGLKGDEITSIADECVIHITPFLLIGPIHIHTTLFHHAWAMMLQAAASNRHRPKYTALTSLRH